MAILTRIARFLAASTLLVMTARLMTLFWLSLGLLAQAQERDDYLGLKQNRPPQRERLSGIGTGAVGGLGHTSSWKPAMLKVTLVSLDKQTYELGEEVIYEITLENISKDDLIIPYSVDYDKVKPDEESNPPGYASMFLSLVINDELTGKQFVAGESLYGSELLSGSLKRLEPGQKVTIRIPGRLSFFEADVMKKILGKLPRTFAVRAMASLSGVSVDSPDKTAISQNSLTLELQRRKE